jgi:hypothetical protein
MEKLEKKKECLNRQEDLLILKKERNLVLERAPTEEKVKVEKLAIELSLANDSKERMPKEKVNYINGRYSNKKDGFGHYKGG